jgi:surface antigen
MKNGSTTITAIGGALLGKDLGGIVGTSLNNSDRAAYDRISQRAMENGEANVWSNPGSGNHGTFVPHATYTNKSGLDCRGYTQAIFINNIPHQGNGEACRRIDGWWQMVSG